MDDEIRPCPYCGAPMTREHLYGPDACAEGRLPQRMDYAPEVHREVELV